MLQAEEREPLSSWGRGYASWLRLHHQPTCVLAPHSPPTQVNADRNGNMVARASRGTHKS